MSLTAKQECFVKEYLIDLNATQAAIRAGYSQKNADKIGSELLGKTRVKEKIQEAMDKRSERTQVSADYVLNTIVDTIERCRQAKPVFDKQGNITYTETEDGDLAQAFVFDASAVLRGAELLGKHLKLFTDKTEITGKDGAPISIEDATVRASRVAALIAQANARKDEAEPTAE